MVIIYLILDKIIEIDKFCKANFQRLPAMNVLQGPAEKSTTFEIVTVIRMLQLDWWLK